jgi:hypothetical protein
VNEVGLRDSFYAEKNEQISFHFYFNILAQEAEEVYAYETKGFTRVEMNAYRFTVWKIDMYCVSRD